MDIQATFDQIQQLNSLIYDINKRKPAAIKLLNTLNRRIFGESVSPDCSNCHIKAFQLLTKLTLKDLEAIANKEFVLLKGILIEYPFRSGQHYINGTMPDSIAREYLTKYPKMVRNFSRYPKEFELK